MPQKRNSQTPPEVMTWRKAAPVLTVAVIFDLLRIFFVLFWFFGPALAAAYCANTASGWVGSLWGLTAATCTVGATAAGAAISAVTIPFGVVMAMAVGLFGWLTVGLILVKTNARIFKENALWFGGSLLISEIPLIGSLPALTGVVWKMHRTQIRIKKAEMKRWEKEQAALQLQERNRQTEQRMQVQAVQQAQIIQQEAANDDQYTQELDNAA